MIAPSAMRARCLAAFDLDPSKTDSLTFGSRGYRRLRVSLHTDVQTSYSTLSTYGSLADIHDDMEAAQLEALDEDLYNEVCVTDLLAWPQLKLHRYKMSLDVIQAGQSLPSRPRLTWVITTSYLKW